MKPLYQCEASRDAITVYRPRSACVTERQVIRRNVSDPAFEEKDAFNLEMYHIISEV